jgi:D-alanine-D-alanine ligase
VNPLPGLHPVRSDLCILSQLAGVSYAELIDGIIRSALQRQAGHPHRTVRAPSHNLMPAPVSQ